MDRLTGMAVFVKAAELRSFTDAARPLGLSPQMIGKHVAELEARLGTRLLDRTTRRQSLTVAGQLFYEQCRAVLAAAEAAETAVQALGHAPRGRLRVNAPVTFGAWIVAPLVGEYLAAHPDVDVVLTLTDRTVDPVEESFDAVVRIGALAASSSLAARPLAPYRLIACAAPAYLARRGEPAEPGELAAHDCLNYVATTGLPADEWSFTATNGGDARSVVVGSRMRVNDARVLLEASLRGEGIILQSDAIVEADLRAGRLRRVLPGWEGPLRPMHLVFSAARPQTPKLRAFIDMVVARLS